MNSPLPVDFFSLHDVSHFPIVQLSSDRMEPGFAARWCEEQQRLLDSGAPFVLCLEEGDHEHESIRDRKHIVLWFKRNRQAFRRVCRGIVGIEPDAMKRAILHARALVLGPVFGVPTTVVADHHEAETIGKSLLASEGGEAPHKETD